MEKKLLLLSILCALILALLMGVIYKYLMNQEYLKEQNNFEEQVEKIIESELLEQDKNQIDQSKRGDNQYNKYYMFHSKTENKNTINELEAQTKAASQQMKGFRSIIISYVDEEKVNDTIVNRNLVTKKYIWDKKAKSFNYSGKVIELSEILLYKNRNEPRLKDIINDEADFLAIKRIVQEQVLNIHASSKYTLDDEEINYVLANDFLTNNSKITIYPNTLEVFFDKEVFGIKKMSISIEKILPFINPKIVSDKDVLKKELDTSKKYVALTFDDGPNDTSTIKLLEKLKKENIKATFFVLGQMVDRNPEVAKQIVREGHEIGSHSYTHPDLTQLHPKEIKEEVLKTDKAVFHATGVLPKIFRPPYGAINGSVAQIIGLPIIQWNVDSEDWKVSNKELIVNKVVQTVEHGSIILIHDIHEISVDSIPDMVNHLRKNGYEFVTVSELLSYSQKPLNQYFGINDNRKFK
ncbi:polysaccharide deacetylase family protein [Enterococcus entomosocium]|uniref:polysaccharide deacetylase family protein n=1 Tax=Enterococcus entomosocium TaxID=3034352 RepID=UPI002647CA61|nr:polysaccharide deacetylase family protein [Enterococcus entomosocium]